MLARVEEEGADALTSEEQGKLFGELADYEAFAMWTRTRQAMGRAVIAGALTANDFEQALAALENSLIEYCVSCRNALADYRTIMTTAAQELSPVPALPPDLARDARVDGRTRATWAWWSPRLAAAAGLLLAGILFGRWSTTPPPTALPVASTPAATAVPIAGPGRSLSLHRLRAAPLSVFSPAARSYLRRLAHQRDSGAVSEGRDS